jgi:plastocyanin
MGIPRTGAIAAIAAIGAFVLGADDPAAWRLRAMAPNVSTAGGTIVGVVTTKETARPAIRATIDPAICGSSLPDESVTVAAGGQLANVVVTVPGVKSSQPAEVAFANEKCRFVPRVGLMRPGGAVKMMSRDATLHTMHAAAADGRAFFNVSIPVQNVTLSRPVDRAGLVTLSCSTHTWMRGFVQVTEELSALSGADGRYRLEGVPAGKYQLRVWHETLKTTAPVTVVVKDGETVTADLTLVK